jgi:hypothetical protein
MGNDDTTPAASWLGENCKFAGASVQLEDWEYYKFIRVDGKYEFSKLTASSPSHRELAAGRKVEAAGLVSAKPGVVILEDSWSSTLGIGSGQQDAEAIAALTGRVAKDKYD